jgi:hypothetical protein
MNRRVYFTRLLARWLTVSVAVVACLLVAIASLYLAHVQQQRQERLDAAEHMWRFYGDEVVETNEVTTIEHTKQLPNGNLLRLSSVKRKKRDVTTGNIFLNQQRFHFWLDLVPPQGSPRRLWTNATGYSNMFMSDYTEPYDFHFYIKDAPTIGIAYLDDKFLYFSEVNTKRPVSPFSSYKHVEEIRLYDLASTVYGSSQWEPIFKIEELARRDGQWQVTVSVQRDKRHATNFKPSYKSTFKRTAPNAWIEVPEDPNTVPYPDPEVAYKKRHSAAHP